MFKTLMTQAALALVATALTAAELPNKQKALSLNPSGKTKVLITGGGGSHNFLHWFGEEDGKLYAAQGARVDYTEDTKAVSPMLDDANLLVISNNKPFSTEWQSSIFAHVNSGKSLLIIHPGIWHNWRDWADYNKTLVGGGSRSHERLGEFDVIVKKPDHPLMKGVPATFAITDELYRYKHDDNGAEIEVLAIGKGRKSGEEFPVIFVVKHAKAKIVGNTLGHDERAHTLPAFQTILKNTLSWTTK
jgi:type 1 glutamine amidotransferase